MGSTRGREREMDFSTVKLAVLIPSYDLDGSLVPTLQSIHDAVKNYAWKSLTFVVSDSSTKDSVLTEARDWAEELKYHFIIDHVEPRRIKKVALNAAFGISEVVNADFVLMFDDDLRLESSCIINLVSALILDTEAVVAIGVTRADPLFAQGRRRAGAWDLEVNAVIASRLPRTFIRTEGAVTATRGSFVATFRYPVGSGSIVEDQALTDFLFDNDLKALNVFEAMVFKVPPLGFREFANQSRRNRETLKSTTTPRPCLPIRVRSALGQTAKNPVGALWYIVYVIGIVLGVGKPETNYDEFSPRSKSTYRASSS